MSYELYSLGNFELFENLCRSSADTTRIRSSFTAAGLHDIDNLTPFIGMKNIRTFSSQRLWCWHFFVSAPYCWHYYIFICMLQAWGIDTFLSQRLWYWHFCTFLCRSKYWHFFVSASMMSALFRLSAFDVDTFTPSSAGRNIPTF
jgi:hypothetical protein